MCDKESQWEDRKAWDEERRREGHRRLTQEEINDIRADESYDAGR